MATEKTDLKNLVDRFLTWKLPEDFRPDGGVSFQRWFNKDTPYPMRHEPVGTNLLTAAQAEAMLRHVLNLPACGCTGPDQCDGECYPALDAAPKP